MTVDELLDELVARRLASDASLSDMRERSSGEKNSTVDSCIDALTERGVLTDYQAGELKRGQLDQLTMGQYVIQSPLGQGGMGMVYLARHDTLGKLVALKVLPEDLAQDERQRMRFRREMETLAKLDHPHIAQTFDGGEREDGSLYFAMEYLSEGTLYDRVRRSGSLPVLDVIDAMVEVCDAIEYAHRKGIVHRDLKPSNLGINEFGVVKVLDLGLAQIASGSDGFATTIDRLTSTGQLLGTVDYMAPEQARGTSDADHRADIYSIGCTLFSLLTGRPPYIGESIMEKIAAHQKSPPPDLKQYRSDVPDSLQQLFCSMVAKAPKDRPDSAQAVREKLQAIAGQTQQELALAQAAAIGAATSGISGTQVATGNATSMWVALFAVIIAAITLGLVAGPIVGSFIAPQDPPSIAGESSGETAAVRPGIGSTSVDPSSSGRPAQKDAPISVTLAEPDASLPSDPVSRRRRLATQIRNRGGEVWFVASDETLKPWAPSRFPDVVLTKTSYLVVRGDHSESQLLPALDSFDELKRVRFEDVKWQPADLLRIRFPQAISRVEWIRSPVNDLVFEKLPTLLSLEHLEFQDTMITGKAGRSITRWAPNLKSLDLIGNESATSQLIVGLVGLSRLMSVSLDSELIDSGSAASLARVVRLEEIKLRGPVDPGQIKALASLRSLRRLQISFSNLTTDTSDAIAGMGRLREITLEGFQGDAASLVALLKNDKLERITLHDCPVAPKTVSAIQAEIASDDNGRLWVTGELNDNATRAAVRELLACGATLTVVERGKTPVACDDMNDLQPGMQISQVVFAENEISLAALATLRGLFGLRQFGMQTAQPTWSKEHSELVSEFTGLTRLRLANVEMSDQELAGLANLRNLRQLILAEVSGGTEAGLQPVLESTDLRQFSLSGIPVSNRIYTWIRQHTGLETLGMTYTARSTANDQITSLVSDLTELQFLQLGHFGLTGRGLSELAKLKSLHTLVLPSTIDDTHLQDLRAFPALNRVGIGIVTPEKIDALTGLPNISNLEFYGGNLTESDLRKLAATPHLKSLLLARIDITDDMVINALRGQTNLRQIALRKTLATDSLAGRVKALTPTCAISVVSSRSEPYARPVYTPEWDRAEFRRLVETGDGDKMTEFSEAVLTTMRERSVADEFELQSQIAYQLNQFAKVAKDIRSDEVALRYYSRSGVEADQAAAGGATSAFSVASWSWTMACYMANNLQQYQVAVDAGMKAIAAYESMPRDGLWSDDDLAGRSRVASLVLKHRDAVQVDGERLAKMIQAAQAIDFEKASRATMEGYALSIATRIDYLTNKNINDAFEASVQAVELSKVVKRRFPDLGEAMNWVDSSAAKHALCLGKDVQATKILSDAIKDAGDDEPIQAEFRNRLTLAVCHTYVGDRGQAEAELMKCAGLVPKMKLDATSAYNLLALLAAVVPENLDPAIVDQVFSKTKPSNERTRARYAVLYAAANGDDASVKSMIQELDPSNLRAESLAAKIHYQETSERDADLQVLMGQVGDAHPYQVMKWSPLLRLAVGWEAGSLRGYWPGRTPPVPKEQPDPSSSTEDAASGDGQNNDANSGPDA